MDVDSFPTEEYRMSRVTVEDCVQRIPNRFELGLRHMARQDHKTVALERGERVHVNQEADTVRAGDRTPDE